jgi:hypothetical protein
MDYTNSITSSVLCKVKIEITIAKSPTTFEQYAEVEKSIGPLDGQ